MRERHRRAPHRADGARHQARRRGDHLPVHFRRHGGDDRAPRREAGAGGRAARHVQSRPGAPRARDHAAHAGDHAGRALRAAGGHGRDQRDRREARPRRRSRTPRRASARRYKGRKSCALSTIGCTSFFPSKPLGCYGDGGAVFTDDDALAQAFREIRHHGQAGRYHHTRLGINGRLDTIQCAILLAKLERFDWEVGERQVVARRYDALLDGLAPALKTLPVRADRTSVYAQYTVRVAGPTGAGAEAESRRDPHGRPLSGVPAPAACVRPSLPGRVLPGLGSARARGPEPADASLSRRAHAAAHCRRGAGRHSSAPASASRSASRT